VARLPRLAVPGYSHLALQRGHNGERVFADEVDRRAYLAALTDASAQHGLRIHGWGLAHNRRGTLWDGRFRAGIVESPHFGLAALLFAETAGGQLSAAELADDSRSSRPHHVGAQRLALVSDHSVYWSLGNTPFDREASYRRLVEQGWGADQYAALANAAEHGWAHGTPGFADRLAEQAARPAQPRRRGRPSRSD
jgi:putative transposase